MKDCKEPQIQKMHSTCQHAKLQMEYTARQKQPLRIWKSPPLAVLPAQRCPFFSRSLFSPPLPCFYLCILPAFRPPSRRERGQEREYQIQTLSSTSSAPLAHNNSSNPKRVPESYWTRFCVNVCAHVDVCAASGLDQDTLFMLLALVPPDNCQEILKQAI